MGGPLPGGLGFRVLGIFQSKLQGPALGRRGPRSLGAGFHLNTCESKRRKWPLGRAPAPALGRRSRSTLILRLA